jgi:nitrite reductase/ring-hydroxylating ferredoxin subunit
MNRKEFLKSLGVSAAFAITYSCLGSCSTPVDDMFLENAQTPQTPQIPQTSSSLLKIDLSDPASNSLKNNGGYLIKNNILVAKNLNGNYVAATVFCSHENLKQMVFRNGEYYCTAHGARFDLVGKGLNSKGSRGLKIYKTSVSGNILTITA